MYYDFSLSDWVNGRKEDATSSLNHNIVVCMDINLLILE
jgi:hypothetical protein